MNEAPAHATSATDRTCLRWWTRIVFLGAGLGFALSSIDQIVVPWLGGAAIGGGDDPALSERLAGTLFTTAGYAATFAAAGISALVVFRFRRARPLAIGAMALMTTGLVTAHVLAVVVRVLSGSFLTIGAIEFFLNSSDHVLRATEVGYGPYLVSIVVMAAIVFGAAIVYLAQSPHHVASPHVARRGLPFAGSLAGVAAIGMLASPARGALASGMWRTTPELAFFASLDLAPLGRGEADGAEVATIVASGPPLLTEKIWQGAAAARTEPKPNVLLITLESIATSHVGYLGYERDVTPNLDRIAAESLRMRRAWTTSTHSNYAQMAILSSLFPRRGDSLDQYQRLDYPRVLFHDLFHQLGYATATVSSQDESWQGMRRFTKTATPAFFWSSNEFEGPHVDMISEKAVPDAATATRAIDWITEQAGAPFALYVNLQMTHFPYNLPKGAAAPFSPSAMSHRVNFLGYAEEYREAVVNRYDNALRYVDEQVGHLAAFLDEAGLAESTILVITSDHGELFGEHGMVTHGKTLYEGESRVPLLVRFPGRVAPADVDVPVSHLDVLPTIAELVDVPAFPSFQGESFAHAAELGDRGRAVLMNIQGLRTAEGIVCFPWKLVVERTSQEVRLFNLEDDPEERRDRLDEEPERAAALRRVLRLQIEAQIAYHRQGDTTRSARFAPRMPRCPKAFGKAPPPFATTN